MRSTPGVQHRLILDTAEGMAYLCNAGVEHRDLKSANCLVTHDWRAKVKGLSIGGRGGRRVVLSVIVGMVMLFCRYTYGSTACTVFLFGDLTVSENSRCMIGLHSLYW